MIHLLKGPFEKASRPLVDFLIKHHYSASQLTIIAFLGTVLASILIYYENWIIGSCLFMFFSLFDALDGTLARRSNSVKPIGAFLDSVMDRFSDCAVFFALIFYAFNTANRHVFLLTLLALIASMITSYIKAKAEIFMEFRSIGLLQRPERVLIIFLMLLLPKYLLLGLWILVIGGYITIGQRIYYACQKFNRQ
ncbi:MAG TPA: CDP-alcohol phosphatidyltransferase family protein [Desulfatiglandales bacterium]|nr:CDP-alcohol phosphatidyltransferase family protein [Desulfatiglandales bacterium]